MADYIVIHGIKVHKDYQNFVPETFGRLTTIGPRFRLPGGNKGNPRYVQVCQCNCAEQNVVVVECNHMRKGSIRSCGCLYKETRAKHGMCQTSEYQAWRALRSRCNNPNTEGYELYGGRGIRVYRDWDCPQGFASFISHIGPKPSPKHSVDRYPIRNGNYEPGNVRWATDTEQSNNTSRNRFITYKEETHTMAEWARLLNIPIRVLKSRINRGWEIARALTEPVVKRKR